MPSTTMEQFRSAGVPLRRLVRLCGVTRAGCRRRGLADFQVTGEDKQNFVDAFGTLLREGTCLASWDAELL
jgi:hypothetical protein